MKIAYYHTKPFPESYPGLDAQFGILKEGKVELYDIDDGLQAGTDMLLSIGGDGTFLSAVSLVAGKDVPVAGVNFGRVGFLSDIRVDRLADVVLGGKNRIEEMEMLELSSDAVPKDFGLLAVNEVAVHRTGAGMLGISVEINGLSLPTYWADGLLVSTGAGSTAYSLSVGGPVCLPEAGAFLVTPIAPHNLNVRPLVVPSDSCLTITPIDREDVTLSVDNRNVVLKAGTPIMVRKAPFRLKRVKAEDSNFIQALKDKLFWGEDLRNRQL